MNLEEMEIMLKEAREQQYLLGNQIDTLERCIKKTKKRKRVENALKVSWKELLERMRNLDNWKCIKKIELGDLKEQGGCPFAELVGDESITCRSFDAESLYSMAVGSAVEVELVHFDTADKFLKKNVGDCTLCAACVIEAGAHERLMDAFERAFYFEGEYLVDE
jgi:hypothetical protein